MGTLPPPPNPSSELETKAFSVTSLLDFVRRGKVRIPRFQRGLRWNDEDRRLLLDSLQAGYPIGTLLLARGRAPADRITLGGYTAEVPEVADALWVVDGQQRLSTLAMALIEDHVGARRPIFFDLEENRFVVGTRRRVAPPHWVPSHVLASSSVLNRWLRDSALSDALSDRADAIAQRIREYVLPAYLVPYDGQNDAMLRQVFARTNRQARALATHEVFQALHAGVRGERGPIESVRDELTKLGFGPIRAQDVQRSAIAVHGGVPERPLQDQIGDNDVRELFDRTASSLALAIEFLAEDVGVPHVNLLPYGASLFTLARFFSIHREPHPRNRELLCRWFWRGAMSGDHRLDYHRERPKWQAIGTNEHASVQALLRLLPPVNLDDLPSSLHSYRRKGSAQVAIELLAMHALGPRWLTGEDKGAEISVASLLASDDDAVPSQIAESPLGSTKTTALFLLHPKLTVDDLRAEPRDTEILASHAMDVPALDALLAGNHSEFYARRTDALVRHLRGFLTERARLTHADRDRPPLDAYFGEESA